MAISVDPAQLAQGYQRRMWKTLMDLKSVLQWEICTVKFPAHRLSFPRQVYADAG